ncbi:MAG TPA: GTP-binding protein [Actinomycetales bacterium]
MTRASKPGATVPVLTVSSVDPVLRDIADAALLCELPGAVVVRHDFLPGAVPGERLLRRVVYGRAGVREESVSAVAHACLSCALREDILPTLRRLAAEHPAPDAVILALPVGSEPLPVVRALRVDLADGPRSGLRPGAALCVLEPRRLEHDLFGEDLLDERGLAFRADDRRSVGEVLARQLAAADVVLTEERPDARAARLLGHLTAGGARTSTLGETFPALLLDASTSTVAARRPDVVLPEPTGCEPGDGVWTLDLQSWRPLHPGRLRQRLGLLAGGRTTGRGLFWLPGRPTTAVAWDGAGGQLSIGPVGTWEVGAAGTDLPVVPGRRASRLVITGVDGDPAAVRACFDECLVTEAELARGLPWWLGHEDGLGEWLGQQPGAA